MEENRFPQYMEVPPNIEAKPIVSPFSTFLSHSSNLPLSIHYSSFLSFPGCWQATCMYHLYDTGHHTNEGSS